MAHTSEQRDHLSTPLCGAKKKNGKLCRAFAGQHTTHLGVGRCKYHGGATPSHNKAAEIEQAQQAMVMLGAPIDVEPTQALMGVLRATAGHVAFLAGEVQQLGTLDDGEAQALMKLYSDERDRLARVAKACLDANIAEKEVTLVRQQTEMMSSLISAVIEDLGLTPKQRNLVGPSIRRHLTELPQPA